MPPTDATQDRRFDDDRTRMVQHLRSAGITHARVLAAMAKVPRHRFIPDTVRDNSRCYGDHPCDIGLDQTISQPFIVAHMIAELDIGSGSKVLEIGSGTGYQSAVLATMGARVFSVEILEELAEYAMHVLDDLGLDDIVSICINDGHHGWLEYAPYDGIILSCATEAIPATLIDQLTDDGTLIAPVGGKEQRLVHITKTDGEVERLDGVAVRFVPMVMGR